MSVRGRFWLRTCFRSFLKGETSRNQMFFIIIYVLLSSLFHFVLILLLFFMQSWFKISNSCHNNLLKVVSTGNWVFYLFLINHCPPSDFVMELIWCVSLRKYPTNPTNNNINPESYKSLLSFISSRHILIQGIRQQINLSGSLILNCDR